MVLVHTWQFLKDGSQIITAPANYDSDDSKFKEYELFERLADNVEYYSWTYNVDQSDVESSYTKLTDTEAFKIIEDCGAIQSVGFHFVENTKYVNFL